MRTRTVAEIENHLKLFADEVEARYILKIPLGDMMTSEDKKKHAVLIAELLEAMKREKII